MTGRRASSLVFVVLIAAVCVIGLFLIDPRAALVSYLAAAVTTAAIAVGALAVMMITYLVRGEWTPGLHVPLVAAALTTPVAGLLFVPVLIGLPWLYPWAQDAAAEGFKSVYLTPWFFVLRTVFYFVVWTVLALWMRASWAQPRRMIPAASAGLIIYALTASFAGVDWLESLTPDFHSSIYGLLFLTFQMLAGLALALAVALARPAAPTFRYGAILLSVLLLWAYNHAMQYIIIWSGNIPDEVEWYSARETGVWGVVLWTLITLQFILPFLAMLSERVRNGRLPLLTIAILTLAMRFVEALVLAVPGTGVHGTILLLSIPAAAVAVGAFWWIAFSVVLEHVRSRPHDTAPLPDAFDAAGTPASAPAPRS